LPLLIPLMIIPIRGGIGLAPMNLSKVYFSSNLFSNHLAVNTIWNILFSLTEEKDLKSKYEFMPDKEAKRIVADIFKDSIDSSEMLLNTQNPNILFIILESFTGKIIDYKLNNIEVTPNLNKWSKEEIYFSNMYASADRTDEGLVAWFSGFPSQPKSAIMNYPDKCSHLPSIIKAFKNKNYTSKFLYGGDISFANMSSYLLLMGIDSLIDKQSFPKDNYNAKWGVHDHILFEKLYSEVNKAKAPYFYSALSLSSHPPYDIPVKSIFEGKDEETMFLNTMHYTDESLGLLIDKLRKSDKWKDLLVIITADHGARFPLNSETWEPSRFKIPMIWMGGAVNKKLNYSKICSQTDFSKTILNQTGNTGSEFIFANNILSKTTTNLAWYAFNNGFTYITDKGMVSYSNDSNSVISKSDSTEQSLKNGKAILQVVTDKFYNY